jgi:hypothetical protein
MRHVVVAVRSRLRQRDDTGLSLIELMTAMTITVVVLALLLPVLTTVTSVSSATNSSSNGTAQARLTLQQLSSDIGSATSASVCFPASALSSPPATVCSGASTSGYPLVVLSKVYGTCTWFQWTVSALGQLTQQSALKGASAWSAPVPLTGTLVNTVSPSLFTYDTTNSLVNIQLVVRGSSGTSLTALANAARNGAITVDLQASVVLYTTAQSAPAGSC